MFQVVCGRNGSGGITKQDATWDIMIVKLNRFLFTNIDVTKLTFTDQSESYQFRKNFVLTFIIKTKIYFKIYNKSEKYRSHL